MCIQQIQINCNLSGIKLRVTNCVNALNGVHDCDIKLINVTHPRPQPM
jgi:hypothetical protein